jgi:hypothetical protein
MKPFYKAREYGIRPVFSENFVLTFRDEQGRGRRPSKRDGYTGPNNSIMKPLPKGHKQAYAKWEKRYADKQAQEKIQRERFQAATQRENQRLARQAQQRRQAAYQPWTTNQRKTRSNLLSTLHKMKIYDKRQLKKTTPQLEKFILTGSY